MNRLTAAEWWLAIGFILCPIAIFATVEGVGRWRGRRREAIARRSKRLPESRGGTSRRPG